MTGEAWILLLVMFTLSASSVMIYMWAKRAGQFADTEIAKYRMLEDEEWEGHS